MEVANDRDRAAHADDDGRFRPFIGKRRLRLGQKGRVVREMNRRRAAMRMELDRAVGRNFRPDIAAEGLADSGRILGATSRNETFAEALAAMTVLKPSPVYPPQMPLTSAVGRAQVNSSTDRPFSPEGMERPTSPRNFSAVLPSVSQDALMLSGVPRRRRKSPRA